MLVPSPDLLAERLRDWRLQQKLDLKEVALACKMPWKKLGDFENGQARLSVQEIEALLSYYGVTADQLLGAGSGWRGKARDILGKLVAVFLVVVFIWAAVAYTINGRIFNSNTTGRVMEQSLPHDDAKAGAKDSVLQSAGNGQDQPSSPGIGPSGQAEQALVMRLYGDALWEQPPPDVSTPAANLVQVYTITALTDRSGLPEWLARRSRQADRIILNLATNHALDAGRDQVRGMLELLQQHGLVVLGLGSSPECYRPAIIDSPQGKVGMLAFSAILPQADWKAGPRHFGVAHAYDQKNMLAAVRQASQLVDLLVVLMHWGTTFDRQPAAAQTALARRLIDAGADLVVGTHPLSAQRVERYGDRYIFYGLGHVTSRYQSSQGHILVLDVQIEHKKISAITLQPGTLRRGRASLADSDQEKERLYRYLAGLLPPETAGDKNAPVIVR
ncbi:MAG: CapA family protein [Desulfurispora sp.]|uniref:CapA family protein n=1 Tax=Desulfurispora sp. TaxID=3014275 RepID=UPI00404AB7A2